MITLTQTVRIAGVVRTAGEQVSLAVPDEAALVARGLATWTDTFEAAPWIDVPTIFRLRLAGTGTLIVDARDVSGTVTEGVATYVAAGATQQIEYPWLGDAAREIRLSHPSTLRVEVLK